MLNENWLSIFMICLFAVAVLNGLLASCTSLLYRNKKWGELSHSQLRVKQGNANFEHRINTFTNAFIFSLITVRLLLISAFLAGGINILLYII